MDSMRKWFIQSRLCSGDYMDWFNTLKFHPELRRLSGKEPEKVIGLGSDESKVKEFCSTEYGVTFPMFATTSVKGNKANSFYKSLTELTGKKPGWNFHKYLISRGGEVLSFD